MIVSVISLPNNKEFYINKESFIFGRDTQNDIALSDAYISRSHCRIFLNEDKYYLEDLNSSNGTFLNGNLIKTVEELKDNDVINLYYNGPMYQFRLKDESDAKKGNFIIELIKQIFKINNLRFVLPVLLILLVLLSFFIYKVLNPFKNNNIELYGNYTEAQLRKEFYNLMNKYEENYYHLDKELFKKIVGYINYYNNNGSFKDALIRREKYRSMIEKIFANNKIPADLSYIAFVESDFKLEAYNPYSGAKGLWQLMPGTAKQYGLKVNKSIDERIDPEKSTEAAAAYINDLLAIFGHDSILLVLAAYNVGEGVINSSLRKIKDPKKDRSFWYLYKNDLMPSETKEYVLKVLALMILCEGLNSSNH